MIRDRTDVYAYRGQDGLWHSDYMNATDAGLVLASSSCGRDRGSVLYPAVKEAAAVKPSELCKDCWP
jgi:hypothetical protein